MTGSGHGGETIMANKPREEYLLYVRVPDPEDQSLEATRDFLVRIAELLSDEDENIYVEAYTRDEVTTETREPRSKHGKDRGFKDEGEEHYRNSVDSTDKNSIRPLYFCHNKF
jgi:hypothetical protein